MKIKHCPFCGSDDCRIDVSQLSDNDFVGSVNCSGCGVHGPLVSSADFDETVTTTEQSVREVAIQLWNDR